MRTTQDDRNNLSLYIKLQQSESHFINHFLYIAANLPNDPEWQNQWYLNRLKYKNYEHHLNVSAAWAMGFTGKGAKVTILDDGIEKDHPDLAKNYDKDSSYDYNSNDDDPMPRYNPSNENRHGTRCAGEVAAVKDNDFCIAGVAPDAFIGGIRMLDGDITDLVECKSVSHNIQHIDVYSSSWGPDDDGKTVDGPGKLTKKAFIDGVRDGRGGKGSIYVWASGMYTKNFSFNMFFISIFLGNGGRYHDSCSCDGYCNSIYTITISSTTEFEKIPWYSEKCSSTLASTYSSGTRPEHSIVSTDLRHGCTQTHTGTSASAPIAAGLIALALEANPNLTWRDVQHIIVKSSNPKILHETGSFHTNSAGLEFSHNYGFGLMDAGRMCELAKNWKTVPEMKLVNINVHSESQSFGKDGIDAVYEIPTSVDGVDLDNFKIETVVIRITLDFTYRGYLEFFIESPTGTESQLLFKRQSDRSNHGFVAWEFMSVFHWDEPAAGKWKFRVVNQEPSTSSNKGHLKKLDFQFTGTQEIDWNNEVTTVTRNTLRDDAENEEPVAETTTENTTESTTTTTTPTTSTSTVNLPPNHRS